MPTTKRKPRRRRRRQRLPVWLIAAPAVLGALAGVLGMWLVGRTWSERVVPAGRPDPVHAKPEQYSWTDTPEPSFPIPPYARFLKGVEIVIDPGHVGQHDPGGTWKRGPTGLREADVNWRVTQFLREFLLAVDARVILTRETTEDLKLPDKEDLARRAAVANEARADLLLSIHHNGSSDPKPNHTLVFYHLSPDHSRASVDAARNLLTGLNDALRLESHAECAVLSDYVLYENGLAVLRETLAPAVLSEASFHSNPAEEARLRDPVYNRREAYGLFLGLARWAQAGLPRVRLAKGGARGEAEAMVALDDGLGARGAWKKDRSRVLPDSIVVRLGDTVLRHTLSPDGRELRAFLPTRSGRNATRLFVDFETELGQHVLHPWVESAPGSPP